MNVQPHFLEQWYRDHPASGRLDISSSGVYPYSLRELLELTGSEPCDVLDVVLDDSTALGADATRHAIADRLGYDGFERIMVTHGSSEALDLGLSAILSPGDDVVVVRPAYHALLSVPVALGCRIVPWDLRQGDGFQVDVERLRSVVGPTTRAMIINFPHNPTGLTLTPRELAEVVRIADATGAFLVFDGAFTDLVYDAEPLPDPGRLTDRVVSTGTLSKAFGAPGLRCGWLAAPPEVLRTAVALRDRGNLFLSPVIEMIAAAVVSAGDVVVGRRLEEAAVNRKHLTDFLSAAPWVRRFTSGAGVTAFARLGFGEDTTGCCRRLVGRGVLTVPGRAFGEPGWVRLGYGGPTRELLQALRMLEKFVPLELSLERG